MIGGKKTARAKSHVLPVEGETLATLDAEAKSRRETRGAALGRIVEDAAVRHGIALRDRPIHKMPIRRTDDEAECFPNQPGKIDTTRRRDGTEATWCVYALIDGRLGPAFSELKSKWRLGSEECLAKIVREHTQGERKRRDGGKGVRDVRG